MKKYWLSNRRGLSQRNGRGWLSIGSMTKLWYCYFLRQSYRCGNLVKRCFVFLFLTIMWLQTLGNKNKASRGKQEDITRHGTKSLAQISNKIVKNKLRIHECVHDIFDIFFSYIQSQPHFICFRNKDKLVKL